MKQQIWFKKAGWFYLPIHFIGMLITLGAIAFLVWISMTVPRTDHSVTDNPYEVFVYATCTVCWWKWVAEKTSE